MSYTKEWFMREFDDSGYDERLEKVKVKLVECPDCGGEGCSECGFQGFIPNPE